MTKKTDTETALEKELAELKEQLKQANDALSEMEKADRKERLQWMRLSDTPPKEEA